MGNFAHMDNSLTVNVAQVLNSQVTRLSYIDLGNMLAFAHSIVLFDKVILPVAPDQNIFATENLPHTLKSQKIFENDVPEDFEERKQEAINQAIMLSRAKCDTGLASPVECMAAYFEMKSAEQGPIWQRHFASHLERYRPDHSPYMNEAQGRVGGYFGDAAYKALSIRKQFEITYVWRSFLHINLALDKDRPYLHNAYRTPFVDSVFDYFDKYLVAPALMKENISVRAMFAGQSPVWKGVLPSLLGKALDKASTPEEFTDSLLTLRNSAAARAFRLHYAQLQSQLSEPSATQKIEQEIKELASLWSGLVEDGPIDLPISLKVEGTGFSFQGQLPSGLHKRLKRIHVRVGKRHLRLIVDMLSTPRYTEELLANMKRIFGPVSYGMGSET